MARIPLCPDIRTQVNEFRRMIGWKSYLRGLPVLDSILHKARDHHMCRPV